MHGPLIELALSYRFTVNATELEEKEGSLHLSGNVKVVRKWPLHLFVENKLEYENYKIIIII